MASLRTARKLGADLKLLNANDKVRSTLYVARLLPIFELHTDEQQALEEFRR